MRVLKITLKFLGLFIIPIFYVQTVSAQGYGGPLTFQGLDQSMMFSAAGRAMGGVTIGVKQDIGLMFHNPATLQSIQGIQVSLGGQTSSSDLEQEQNYAPVRYYSNLGLLLEGLTAHIPDPDTSLVGCPGYGTKAV
jgi:hypothetical protein